MDSGELAPGATIAGHRVERRLGKGGMGAVYEATELASGRRVALKVLTPELGEEPKFVERFRREAEAAASLMHPNIVQVERLVHAPGEPIAIVMELLEGRSLLEVLRSGALDAERARGIAMALAAALAAAHGRGIVHRDLKPGNVHLVPLPGGGEQVKLLDFGIAKLRESDGYSRLTQTGILIGTPRFASPEQVRGSRDIDGRSDIFSLGVLLYGMLSGRPPFLGKGAQLLLEIQEREPPALPASVPEALVHVVARAMRKDRAARFPSADAMGAALVAAAPGASHPTERGVSPLAAMHAPTRVGTPRTVARPSATSAPATVAHAPYPSSPYPSSPYPSSPYPSSPHPTAPGRPRHSRPVAPARSRGRAALIAGLAAVALLTTVGAGLFGVLLWRRAHHSASPTSVDPSAAAPPSSSEIVERIRQEGRRPPAPGVVPPEVTGRAWRPSYGALRHGGACVELERRVCQCEAPGVNPATAQARCNQLIADQLESLGEHTEASVIAYRGGCRRAIDQEASCEHSFTVGSVQATAARLGADCIQYLHDCGCAGAPPDECHTAAVVIGPSYDGLVDVALTRRFCRERAAELRSMCR